MLCNIPPENSVIVCPDSNFQQTLPELNVWLFAITVADFIFVPTDEKSNFQEIFPVEEPSVRAMYTWNQNQGKKKKLTITTNKLNNANTITYEINKLRHFGNNIKWTIT